MKFIKYQSLPMSAKISELQKRLIELGFDKVTVTGKRDKATIKALMKFQKDNDIVPNGVICERTFTALNI